MGTFRHNSTGIDPDAVYPLLPDGWFPFKIVEAEAMQAKSGNNMVLAKCKCIDDRYSDCGVIWHYVVFIEKGEPGEGISVHFRKCIGEPYGGDDVVDTDSWEGKKFMGKVKTETYDSKKRNKIAEVSPFKADAAAKKSDSDIPF